MVLRMYERLSFLRSRYTPSNENSLVSQWGPGETPNDTQVSGYSVLCCNLYPRSAAREHQQDGVESLLNDVSALQRVTTVLTLEVRSTSTSLSVSERG